MRQGFAVGLWCGLCLTGPLSGLACSDEGSPGGSSSNTSAAGQGGAGPATVTGKVTASSNDTTGSTASTETSTSGATTNGSSMGAGGAGTNSQTATNTAAGGASTLSTTSEGTSTGAGTASGSGGSCEESSCGSHKWACWKMPTPASSPPGVPNPQQYTDLGNGTVRDEVTCLIWEQDNPADQGTWQQSYDRCAALAAEGFAGFDDWRLPTRIEMASITDVTLGRTGYPSVFGVTSGYYVTGSFWYKTILSDNEDRVWGYGTNGFTSNAIVRSNTDNVARCVRGNGPGEAAGDLAVEPENHYTIDVDTVRDNYTELIWQRGHSPNLMTWEEAPVYCGGLNLDGFTGFRVPTLNELATTVNEALVGGAIVESAFPDNPNGCAEPQYWFWAAEASTLGGTGWGLSYCDGFTGYNAGSSGDWNYFPTANVRCVKSLF